MLKQVKPQSQFNVLTLKKREALVMITDDQLKGEISPFKYGFSFDKGWFPSKFHSLQVVMPNFW